MIPNKRVVHDDSFGSPVVARDYGYFVARRPNIKALLIHKVYAVINTLKDKVLVVNISIEGGAVIVKRFFGAEFISAEGWPVHNEYAPKYDKNGALLTAYNTYYSRWVRVNEGDNIAFLDQAGQYGYSFMPDVPTTLDVTAISNRNITDRGILEGQLFRGDAFVVMRQAWPDYTPSTYPLVSIVDLGFGVANAFRHLLEPTPTFMGDFVRLGMEKSPTTSDIQLTNFIEIGKPVTKEVDGVSVTTFARECNVKPAVPLVPMAPATNPPPAPAWAVDMHDALHFIEPISGKEILLLSLRARTHSLENNIAQDVGLPRALFTRQFILADGKNEEGKKEKQIKWEGAAYSQYEMRTLPGFDHQPFNYYRWGDDFFMSYYDPATLTSHIYRVSVVNQKRLRDPKATTLVDEPCLFFTPLDIPVLPNGERRGATGALEVKNLYSVFTSKKAKHYYFVRFKSASFQNSLDPAYYKPLSMLSGFHTTMPCGRTAYHGLDCAIHPDTELIVEKRRKTDLFLVETYNLTPSTENMQGLSVSAQVKGLWNRMTRVYRPTTGGRVLEWHTETYRRDPAGEECAVDLQRFCPILSRYGGYVEVDRNGQEHPIMSVKVVTQKTWPGTPPVEGGTTIVSTEGGIGRNLQVSAALLYLTKTPNEVTEYRTCHTWDGVDAVALTNDEIDIPANMYETTNPAEKWKRAEKLENIAANISLGSEGFGSMGDHKAAHFQNVPCGPIFHRSYINRGYLSVAEWVEYPTSDNDPVWAENYRHPSWVAEHANYEYYMTAEDRQVQRLFYSVTLKEFSKPGGDPEVKKWLPHVKVSADPFPGVSIPDLASAPAYFGEAFKKYSYVRYYNL